ncbi:CDP-glycerol glycerophosphotransferase family protein [Pseudomonas sp. TE3610]
MRKLVADLVVLPLWRLIDRCVSKKPQRWGFCVHHLKSDQFVENARAVFEAVKADPALEKIIFTRGVPVTFTLEGAVNTRIVDLQTLTGLFVLWRCKVLLVTHSVSMDLSMRWPPRQFSVVRPALKPRTIINLWHGIPLKKLLALANDEVRKHTDRVAFRRIERSHYAGLITSSAIDSHAMATMFHPITYDRVWVTGLPRSDFLVMPRPQLPAYLRDGLERIERLKGDKTLIVYAPTYRQVSVAGAAYYQFSEQEAQAIRALLARHNAILGIRLHYFKNAAEVFNIEQLIDGQNIVELDHQQYPDIACVLRAADLVVTDYSSVYIDALYLDKPVFSFAYDLEHYQQQQDGVLYDLDLVFPGPVVGSSDALLQALDQELRAPAQVDSDRYRMARKLFFAHTDAGNCQRVIERIRQLA